MSVAVGRIRKTHMEGSDLLTSLRFRPVAFSVLFACAMFVHGQARAGDTLKIYLMGGQSNMEGHAFTYHEGMNARHNPAINQFTWTLEYLIDHPEYVATLDLNVYTFNGGSDVAGPSGRHRNV